MTTEPRLEHRDEQPYVAIRTQASMTEIPTVLPPLIPEVLAWLKDRAVEPAGVAFFRYLDIDMDNQLLVDVGVPVGAAVPGDGRVVGNAFPAGEYVVQIHTGPYEGLRSAWAALEDWKHARGIEEASVMGEGGARWGTRSEFYLTDPVEELDPSKWRTEMVFLVKDNHDES